MDSSSREKSSPQFVGTTFGMYQDDLYVTVQQHDVPAVETYTAIVLSLVTFASRAEGRSPVPHLGTPVLAGRAAIGTSCSSPRFAPHFGVGVSGERAAIWLGHRLGYEIACLSVAARRFAAQGCVFAARRARGFRIRRQRRQLAGDRRAQAR